MSKIDLAHLCQYGFRPDVERFPRAPGDAALIGTDFHALAEHHVKGTQPPMVREEARRLYESPVKAFLDSVKWTACEIGLEYDAENDTARPCVRRGEPGYEDVGPMALRGTLDLVRVYTVDGVDVADVIDLKTGKKDNCKTDQLYAQAVAVSRSFGIRKLRIAFAYVRKTKFDPPVFEELDEDRLDEEAGRISRTLRRLPMAEPNRGDWCWRCDARPACPAWLSDVA